MPLSVDSMVKLAENVIFFPGWHVKFVKLNDELGRLEISTDEIPNSRYEAGGEKQTTALYRREYLPKHGTQWDARTFYLWVLYEVLWLYVHEGIEWFRFANNKEPVFDAHEADDTATGLLPPRPGEVWFRDLWWTFATPIGALVTEAQKVIDQEYREDIDFRPLQEAIDKLGGAK